MWFEVILLLLIVLGGTAGELCITRAMKVTGEVKDFRPLALLRVFRPGAAGRMDVVRACAHGRRLLCHADDAIYGKRQLCCAGHGS
jgi:hypothetical protein